MRKFGDGNAERIKDHSSGAVADDLYHRYKVWVDLFNVN